MAKLTGIPEHSLPAGWVGIVTVAPEGSEALADCRDENGYRTQVRAVVDGPRTRNVAIAAVVAAAHATGVVGRTND